MWKSELICFKVLSAEEVYSDNSVFWGLALSQGASQVSLVVKSLPANAGDTGKRHGFHPCVGKIPWRKACQPTPVFLPGESPGQRGLAGSSLRGHKELAMTERARTSFLGGGTGKGDTCLSSSLGATRPAGFGFPASLRLSRRSKMKDRSPWTTHRHSLHPF